MKLVSLENRGVDHPLQLSEMKFQNACNLLIRNNGDKLN